MIQKSETFLNEKYVKLTKQKHVFKGFASFYNVEILNYFNPELQLKDTESAIKSKLIDLLLELRGSKFVTTLVLSFKKTESEDKRNYDTFIRTQNPQLSMKRTLMMFSTNYTTIIRNIKNI